jgi:HlyD family secretion protein/epimerase transport system membrane fusion protein
MSFKDFLTEKYSNYSKVAINNNLHNFQQNPVKNGIKNLIIFLLILLCFAIFLPIDQASIAQGIVVLDLKRKSIQHRDGGIIEKILVNEGQIVNENDILVTIIDTKIDSQKNILQQQLCTAELQKKRLEAQLSNHPKIDFLNYLKLHNNLTDYEQEFLKKIIKIQNQIFLKQKKLNENQIKILKNKFKSAQKILNFFIEESAIINQLISENNISILRQFELEKSIIQAQENVNVLELEINNYQQKELLNYLKEIKESETEIISLSNQLKNIKDQVQRLDIRSPSNGKVMNLKYHNSGAVISPANEIMSIIPQDDELIIEAKINPNDIDNISIGSPCKIELNAFKGKKFPRINGKIFDISGDILFDEVKKDSFFFTSNFYK